MKTNDERLLLIENRKKEIERRERRIRQRMIMVSSCAVCVCLVVFIGLYISSLGVVSSGIYNPIQTASFMAEGGSVGYVLVGLLCFLLGVCLTLLLYKLRENNNDKKGD